MSSKPEPARALERPTTVSVLVVDDEQSARDLCCDVATDTGLRARGAATTEEALEIMDQFPVDIVITDLRVPELGGQRLVLGAPTAFTGTLANLGIGDRIDLGTNDIQSAVTVGNTLHVTMTDNSTLDYLLSGQPSPVSFLATGSDIEVQCFLRGTRWSRSSC